MLVRLYIFSCLLAILTWYPLPILVVGVVRCCGGCKMCLIDPVVEITTEQEPQLLCVEILHSLSLSWDCSFHRLLPINDWVWQGYRFVFGRHRTYLLTNFRSETPRWLFKTRLDLDCKMVCCPSIQLSALLSFTQGWTCTEVWQPSQPTLPPSLFFFTQIFP